MGAVVDDFLGAAAGSLAAQVGHALFGHDDVYVVFGRVYVGAHGHDGTYPASLGYRWCGEYAYVSVALVVAASAYAVHEFGAADVAGILVAVEVALDGGVEGYHAQSPDDFGAVGHLALAYGEVLGEVVHIVVDRVQTLVGDGHGCGRGVDDFAFEHPLDGGVLYHLGVDVEAWYVLVGAEGCQHGVAGGSHAALYGQELWRYAAVLHVVDQEFGHIVTHL